MYIFVKTILYFFRKLPARLLTNLTYRILYIIKYRKQTIEKNFKSTIALSCTHYSFEEFYALCLKNISRVLIETLTINTKKSSSVVYENIENLESTCINGNGLLLLASHYGNWELSCIHLPLHTDIPCYGVYKPLKNKTLDKTVLKLRSQYGLKLIPMNSIVRTITENVRKNKPAIYILIADQNPRSIQNVVWTEFLGKMTAFSKGFLKFRKKYNFQIAYMKTEPLDDLYAYTVSFDYPEKHKNIDEVQWYSERLASQINQNPQYWLWSHNRWKRNYTSIK